ncbi:OX-2 membrane glycoprotein-like isoform X2 [Pagrus major]|uniref:OX-2 membrane glycoprotein-like isoform X2 n=1 Tax=Pagrus major TaxID=143350 RepID=UPI003CC8700F
MDLSALLFFTSGLFQKGLTDLIRTQLTVMAAVGDEALLNCQLVQFKDVVQVTWWKVLPEREETLVTYTTTYGERVNPDFKDKVEFADAGLQSSSIIIRNVTEQDEGCYHCLFNADPEGALIGTTCLQVYELHEPVLHVGDSNSEETVVSCSATGRPAPTVTLTVLRDNVHFSDPVSVSNTNGTVTVTSTAVLTGLHDDSTEVRCAVRVLSGPQKQSADGSAWIIIIVIIIVVCVAAFVYGAVLLIRKPWNSSSHRDPEKITTPQKPNENTQENKTPLMQKVNELMRRRTSTGKKRKTDSPTVSSSTRGTNQQLSGIKTPSMKEENEKVRLTSAVKKTERDSAKLSSSTRGINRQLFPPKSTI